MVHLCVGVCLCEFVNVFSLSACGSVSVSVCVSVCLFVDACDCVYLCGACA